MNETQFNELLKNSKGKLFLLVLKPDNTMRAYAKPVKEKYITFNRKRMLVPLDYLYVVTNGNSPKQKPVLCLNHQGLPIKIHMESLNELY